MLPLKIRIFENIQDLLCRFCCFYTTEKQRHVTENSFIGNSKKCNGLICRSDVMNMLISTYHHLAVFSEFSQYLAEIRLFENLESEGAHN